MGLGSGASGASGGSEGGPPATPDASATLRAMSTPKILVIDDDQPIRILMQNLLREFRFEALVAGSGAEALELAKRELPQVILVDLHMPGMSGEETIAALRKEEALSETPIMILTGEPLSPEELRRLGARAGIQKPFDLPSLISEIRSAIGAPA